MYRFIAKIVMVGVMICLFPIISLAAPTVIIDGKALNCDQPPIIINGNTLVPMRPIFEALGAEITWNSQRQTVRAKRLLTIIEIPINSKNATLNENEKISTVTLANPAIIINGNTMVPLRSVCDLLGAEVTWNGSTQTVMIKSNYGSMPWEDGQYTGQLKDGIPSGLGYIKWDAYKSMVIGQFSEGMLNGSAYYKSPDTIYTGAFKDNNPVFIQWRDEDGNIIKEQAFDESGEAIDIGMPISSNQTSASPSPTTNNGTDYLQQLKEQQAQQQAESDRIKQEAKDKQYNAALNLINSQFNSKVSTLNSWRDRETRRIQENHHQTGYGNQLLTDMNNEYASRLQELEQWKQSEISKINIKYGK